MSYNVIMKSHSKEKIEMSRQIFQMRVDDETNTMIDYLKVKLGSNQGQSVLNLKMKEFLIKLYECERSKDALNNIV